VIALTIFGLLLLTFLIGRVMPIDPVLSVVGPDADRSTYDQVYKQMGWTGLSMSNSAFTSMICCMAISGRPCSRGTDT